MPTILVADDNSNIQKMVSLVFQEKGIHVVAVGNGEAACRKVPEVKPDIVLADVFMPVRNGYEVCEFVKRDSRFSETPVILLVGAFDPLDEKEARRVGADGVLKKPFVPPEPLISLVGSLLQKSEKPENVPTSAPASEPQPPAVAAAPVAPAEPRRGYSGYESEPRPEPRRTYQAEPEPEPAEDQISYGIAGRDSDAADSLTTTERETVAAPSAPRDEDQDDNSESATDWKRRRMAVDYEIPAEESANLVEHLAGEIPPSSTAEADDVSKESEERAAEAPVPVEESKASAPEAAAPVTSEPEPPHVPASEWSSYVPVVEKESPAAESAKPQEVAIVPSEPAPSVEAPVAEISLTPESSAAPVGYVSHAQVDTEIEKDGEQNQQPSEFIGHARQERDDYPTEPPSVIPFPSTSGPEPSQEFAVEQNNSAWESQPSEIVAPPEEPPTAHAVVEQAVQEAASQPESEKQTPMDQATLDSIVAKVVEKLEPQLHQALSQGVLKPLIQELLKGELKPDK
ncbi:MAG TPA: response regulator [Candidatus Acidoferrales bacterium]|nr:response regulator [Candidatus Acidoferrales bacterium]